MIQVVDSWSQYWASGMLTSLPENFASNYDREVLGFWRNAVTDLPSGSEVLDICSGNGAIGLLLARLAQEWQRDWSIECTDAAEIHLDPVLARWPEMQALVQTIRFRPGQRFESHPRPSGSLDLCASQYGIEYCDWPQAARKVAGILRPGGRLVMVNHAPDSAFLSVMQAERDLFDRIAETGLFEHFHAWQVDDLELHSFREALKQPSRTLKRLAIHSQAPLARQVAERVLDLCQANDDRLQQLEPAARGFFFQLEAGRVRLADMLRVNERIAAQPDWHTVFTQAGLHLIADNALVQAGRHHLGRARVFIR